LTCVICKGGEVKPGRTTLTVERGALTLVIKDIPARVCGNCGEAYFDDATTAQIEVIVEKAESSGVQVAVQAYAAA
jgi:YgiT-type zinc finger domain-containing protein